MNSISTHRPSVKPAVCESKVIEPPIAPCEILPNGAPGFLQINDTVYAAEILGYLPKVGEPVIDAYRLTKDNGEAHDICLVGGRLECSCGDWIYRRACQVAADLQDCKHCKAVRQHFTPPVDQQPKPKYVPSATVELSGSAKRF